MSRRLRTLGTAVVLMTATVTLAACGDGSTATQDTTKKTSSSSSSTQATDASASASAAASNTESGPAGTTGTTLNNTQAAEVLNQQGATGLRTATEDAFLANLASQQLSLTGAAADQVIASGHEYCQAKAASQTSFTLAAVAGQLVQQGVAGSLTEAQITQLLTAAADNVLCTG